MISKPCPFLCLLRVGNGQLISQGELEVFLCFPPAPNPHTRIWEDRKEWLKRLTVLFIYYARGPARRGTVALSAGCTLRPPGSL